MNRLVEQLNMKSYCAQLLNAVNDGIVYENPDGHIIFANNRYCQMTGQNLSELINQPFLNFIHPSDRNVFLNKTAQCDHIKQASYPIRIQNANSQVLETMVSVQAIFDDQNNHIGNLAVLTDITELEQQKRALTESKTNFKALLNASNEAIFIHHQGILLEANDQFFTMYGYEPHELIGNQITGKLLTPQSSIIAKKHFQSGTEESIELTAVKKDGTQFPILSSSRNMTYFERPVCIISVLDLTNITDCKQIQQKLEDYQKKISHTERLAGLGTMTASICHEINQPLTVLNLTLQELQHQLKNDLPQKIIAQYIQNSLDSVSNSMSILRQFQKSSRLNDPLESKAVNLSKLLENLQNVFKGPCQKNNVRIILAPSIYKITPFKTECDIEQVLFILIHNAIDASNAPNAHEIRICTEYHDHRLILMVSDQGTGIPTAHHEKIFEPFFTTKPRDKGTGLGLSIAKQILDNCGGQITYINEQSRGCTFSVTIPTSERIRGNRNDGQI